MSPMAPKGVGEPQIPQRRASDGKPIARASAWLRQNERLVFATWLMIISLTVVYAIFSDQAQSRKTNQAARATCLRTVEFGPALAEFFENGRLNGVQLAELQRVFTPDQVKVIVAIGRKGVFTPKQAKAYREGIPTSCP